MIQEFTDFKDFVHCQFKNRSRKENDFELSKEKILSSVANY